MVRGYRKIRENQIFLKSVREKSQKREIRGRKILSKRFYLSVSEQEKIFLTKKFEVFQIFLHKMYIFLEKSDNVRLQKNIFELIGSEPFISYKSFLSARTWFMFSFVFDEEEWNFLMDDGGTFEISGDEWIGNLVHEFHDFEIFFCKSGFFRYFSDSRLHRSLISLDMSLRKDILEFVFCIFPGEHEYLDLFSDFSIDHTASTLFMEFCHGRYDVRDVTEREYIRKTGKSKDENQSRKTLYKSCILWLSR